MHLGALSRSGLLAVTGCFHLALWGDGSILHSFCGRVALQSIQWQHFICLLLSHGTLGLLWMVLLWPSVGRCPCGRAVCSGRAHRAAEMPSPVSNFWRYHQPSPKQCPPCYVPPTMLGTAVPPSLASTCHYLAAVPGVPVDVKGDLITLLISVPLVTNRVRVFSGAN